MGVPRFRNSSAHPKHAFWAPLDSASTALTAALLLLRMARNISEECACENVGRWKHWGMSQHVEALPKTRFLRRSRSCLSRISYSAFSGFFTSKYIRRARLWEDGSWRAWERVSVRFAKSKDA